MATTTTAHASITLENTTGHVRYMVKYRLSGTSVWVQYNTSGSTISASGLAINMLYDFQVVNVNNSDNPSSAIAQSINITDPNPSISPSNISVGYQFNNLSTDITGYTTEIALASSPSTIIATHSLPPGVYPNIISDTFTGLNISTTYILTIIPASGVFYNTFSYTFTTTVSSICPAPTVVSASLS